MTRAIEGVRVKTAAVGRRQAGAQKDGGVSLDGDLMISTE